MTSLHFSAFLWLRWRLFVNQIRKGGIANRVILALLAVSAVFSIIVCFIGAFVGGLFGVPHLSSSITLLIWDGLVLAFLFTWSIGLLNELQRSEVLTFEKFLHLPVSLAGVFFLNYLSSFLSVNLMFFVPVTLGFTVGAVIGQGVAMLAVAPLVIAFFFAVTALTYQFQGWLASLMVNKRRRRTIIVMVTLVFIVVCQLPNLINLVRWDTTFEDPPNIVKEKEDLRQALDEKKITALEYQKKLNEVTAKRLREGVESGKQLWNTVQEIAWLANTVLPPGWLPLGAATAHDGNVVPSLLATAAFALIGAASLWRAYRTVLKLYTGEFTASKAVTRVPETRATTPSAPVGPSPGTLLDRVIPGLSEHASAVALAGFRALLRAPESKMLLLTPIVIVVVFGGMFWRGAWKAAPAATYPLIGASAISLILFTLIQLMGNQFGFDRAGFRIYVLSPAPRRDILLGKNLAVAPVVGALVCPILAVMPFFLPMRIDHFALLIVQFVTMFMFCAMWANSLSIVAPMPIAAGSLKPANPKGLTILIQLFFTALLPITLSPTFIPIGVESLLMALGVVEGWPIALVLMLVECALVACLYRYVLGWQGKWLESRELKILETVTTKAE